MNMQTFLLLILGGVFASTLLIVLLFIIINVCISKKGPKTALTHELHKTSEDVLSYLAPKDIGNKSVYRPSVGLGQMGYPSPSMYISAPMTLSLVQWLSFLGPHLVVARYAATPENHTMSGYEMSSTFRHNGQEDIRPPLPPRNQFDTESLTNSYEEMPENPVVTKETLTLHNANINLHPETRISIQDNISASESYDDVNDLQNGKLETSALQNLVMSCPPETHINFQDNVSASESYDDVDKLGENVQNSYEDIASLPDYLEVEPNVSPNESDNESENYDNVTQLHSDNEDYDDVG